MGDPMSCIADGKILVQSGKDKIHAASSSTLIDAKLEKHQSCGTSECPSCGQKFECKEAIKDWPELPAGVRFDPTDQELLEHLEAKVNFDGSKPHPLIDEFIPTLDGEDGICYTHPEKLPGVKRDGHNKHFFHRPSKAYTTGTRKRRKIQTECDLQGGETRWHKTGKTRPVMVNGKQKGCKKILVLYTNFGKHRKPEKTNWVMHQYHLGLQEEEKEGELVVSKVFYQTQPRQCNWERAATDIADTAVSSDIINRTHDYSAQNFMNQGAGVQGSAHIFAAANSMSKPPAAMRDDGTGPRTYNANQIMQHVKTDYFPYAPCKSHFDHEGISDSGKGSESSQGTPHSCDEHEEHEGSVNAAKQTFGMYRDIHGQHFDKGEGSLIPMEIKVPRQLPNPETWAAVSQHPNEGRDMVFDENMTSPRSGVRLTSNAKLEDHEQRQIKTEGRPPSSSPQKLTFEDIFMPDIAPEIKEEAALTNYQVTDWLKYSFWPDSDTAEHHRLL